jgi:endoglucanase
MATIKNADSKTLSRRGRVMKSIQNLAILLAFIGSFHSHAQSEQCDDWAQWEDFKTHFITPNGRVIDLGSEQNITTSEGQSYALFFALVGNDKTTFDTLLNWTENNLSEGDLSTRLPAWKWGEDKNKEGAILDSNPASDSDLWIAYSLSQAAKLWGERRYSVLANVLAKRIIREETAYIPDLGVTLLPGPTGFEFDNNRYKLNPSYSPLFIYQQFSELYPHSPWQALHQNSAKVIFESSKQGVTPDWLYFDTSKGVNFDKTVTDIGNYNAIRNYLWAGMMAADAPYKIELIKLFTPFINKVEKLGYVPLNTYALSGKVDGKGKMGFNAALLPLLANDSNSTAVNLIKQALANNTTFKQTNYYESVLYLFGTSAFEQRFTIDAKGTLLPSWSRECQ